LREQVLLGHPRRFPVTLLDAPGVDQEDALHAEGRRAGDDAIQHLRPWKSQDERERERRWWILIHRHHHLERVIVESRDLSAADAPSRHADDQRVPHRRTMHVHDVLAPAAGETDASIVEEVAGEEEDEIH
jgi:hypothetical protein